MLTHAAVLRRSHSAYGSRIAISSPSGLRLTHADLDLVTNRVANALLEKGLRPGDSVVWLNQNCVEYLIAYFATAKAGLMFSPLNYWLRPSELQPLYDLVDPRAVITSEDYRDTIDRLSGGRDVVRVLIGAQAEGWCAWDSLLDADPAAPVSEVSEDTPHEVIFTSGTTGQSKGVVRSQRKRIIDTLGAALTFQVNGDDHMVWFLPQFHIGGGAVPNQVLIQGGRVTVLPKFDPAALARAIADGATYMVGVPAHYNLLFESGALEGQATGSMRGCYVGGSVAGPKLFGLIRQHFPAADLIHGYGSTESGPHSIGIRGPLFEEKIRTSRHLGLPLGLPVPLSEVRVVGADGEDVPAGEPGELWVRSGAVMDGYLKQPDLTSRVLSPDGWLRTGDLVRRDQDGFFYMVDRLKDMIITGGENVFPREIEDVIATHPSVAEVAVIGVPDPIYEERVIALVRLLPNASAPDPADLIAMVRSQLAGYKTPKEVHFVDDFPRTATGKVAKTELRAAHGTVFQERG